MKLGTLDAWRIELDVPGPQGATFVLSTFFSYREGTWRITGLSPAVVADRHRGRMVATTRSFRPISPEQRARAGGMRIELATARAGEDVAALCERAGSGWSATRTAVANGLEIGQRFAGGELVKVARPAAS